MEFEDFLNNHYEELVYSFLEYMDIENGKAWTWVAIEEFINTHEDEFYQHVWKQSEGHGVTD